MNFTLFGVMLVGLFGLVIPIFPGGVVIWLAALVYGLFVGFDLAGGILFALITLLMIAIGLADNFLMGKKARDAGASWRAIILGLSAGILGTLIFPPLGGIIAAPLTLYVVEYIRLGEANKAFTITKGLILGWGWSFVVRFGLGLVMIGLWGIWVFAAPS